MTEEIKTKPRIKNPKLLAVSIIASQLAGIIGSVATTPNIPTWYASLNKPVFNPPNWLFGPVWITLYTLMGISIYLIWVKVLEKKAPKVYIHFFMVHLIVNTLWSLIFFGMKDIQSALVVILVLWIMILAMIFSFYKTEKKASFLLVPYFLWVSFASILNYSLMILN